MHLDGSVRELYPRVSEEKKCDMIESSSRNVDINSSRVQLEESCSTVAMWSGAIDGRWQFGATSQCAQKLWFFLNLGLCGAHGWVLQLHWGLLSHLSCRSKCPTCHRGWKVGGLQWEHSVVVSAKQGLGHAAQEPWWQCRGKKWLTWMLWSKWSSDNVTRGLKGGWVFLLNLGHPWNQNFNNHRFNRHVCKRVDVWHSHSNSLQ